MNKKKYLNFNHSVKLHQVENLETATFEAHFTIFFLSFLCSFICKDLNYILPYFINIHSPLTIYRKVNYYAEIYFRHEKRTFQNGNAATVISCFSHNCT